MSPKKNRKTFSITITAAHIVTYICHNSASSVATAYVCSPTVKGSSPLWCAEIFFSQNRDRENTNSELSYVIKKESRGAAKVWVEKTLENLYIHINSRKHFFCCKSVVKWGPFVHFDVLVWNESHRKIQKRWQKRTIRKAHHLTYRTHSLV